MTPAAARTREGTHVRATERDVICPCSPARSKGSVAEKREERDALVRRMRWTCSLAFRDSQRRGRAHKAGTHATPDGLKPKGAAKGRDRKMTECGDNKDCRFSRRGGDAGAGEEWAYSDGRWVRVTNKVMRGGSASLLK